MLKLGYAAGRVLATRRRRTHGRIAARADRQGHAHLGLPAGGRARGGAVGRRRRRRPDRAAADAGGRLPDARAAAVRRHRHQRVAQSVRRQRHQVLLGGGHQAAGRRRARDRARTWTSRSTCVPSASSARRGASTTRPAATSSSARARFPTELDLRGFRIVVDCAHGAGYHVAPLRVPRARRRGDRRRRRARRPQHQCRRRRDASALPRRAGEATTARTSASRSMATATGC